jgi:LytS/YehU family sensor histidine kinase
MKLSLYWKCQLIGWGLFSIATHLALVIGYPGAKFLFLRSIWICLCGLLFTHLIRFTIKKLKVFNKKFSIQILYILVITIVLTFLANLIFLLVLSETGVLTKNQIPGSDKVPVIRLFFYLYYQELMVAFSWVSIYFLVHYIRSIKEIERDKAQLRIQLVESEAQALRAQMNPHFIFNSLNSIKALMHNNQNLQAIEYLTSFSKLIRTLFQNSDKRQVSLFDEIETCKLYVQLEEMRLGEKLIYIFDIDPELDIKSISVPGLIVQPFIENAIWHGIVPKGKGTLSVRVRKVGESVICEIDDDGIGRKVSMLNKSKINFGHESKGVQLTQKRINYSNLLKELNAEIHITDKEGERGPQGTTVTLKFMPQ